MSRHLLAEPRNDAQLFDMLHGLLGIGDFDELRGPWFQFRMTEIAKLKSLRRRRHITVPDMAVAARFCYHRRIAVRQSWEVCGFIDAARRDARNRRVSDLSKDIADAIANERLRPDCDEGWVRRLLLARGDFRREVLEQWAEARQ